ncbi:MAG: LAGLIDADG family homing endonuclease, partial [Methanosarcinales archaeon]
MKEGEFIATPRSVANQPEYSNTSILNFLDKTAHLLNAQDIIKHILERVRERGTIRDFARKLQIDENQLCHSWRLGKGSPQLDILETMCNHVNLELEEVLPEKMQLMQYNGHVINLSKSFTTKLLYLIGLVAGDGNVSRTPHGGFCIEFHSAEKELLEKFYTVCQNELNIEPHYYKHPDRIAYCSINSKIVAQLMHKLGVPNGKKSQHIEITQELSNLPNELVAAYLHGLFDTDGCVVEPKNKGSKFVSFSTSSKAFAKGLQLLLLRFGILSSMRKKAGKTTYIKNRPVISKDKYEIELRGLENLLRFKEEIGFGFSKKKEKLEKIIRKISKTNTNIDIVPEISNLLASARKELGISAKTLYGYKNYSYEMGRRKPSRQQLAKIVGKMKSFGNSKTIERLEKLAKSDIFWDEIKDVEIVKNKQFDDVYDVTVEDEHSLIADGIIIHNTATVTKDEEFMGGWVLEAGAMVLCHKGIIAIDEFDKMHKDDQIAMHEAMSTQSYHGDTKITLSDGSIKSIRNIVENMLEK